MLPFQIYVQCGISYLMLSATVVLADTLSVTITASPAFQSQRTCAFGCFVGAFHALNPFYCPSNPIENACWCRDDLIQSAASSISTCISAACSGNSIDVQSGTSLYLSYCSQNGYIPTTPTADAGGKAPTNQRIS